MWLLFLLFLRSLSLCAPPFSQELKHCDASGPRVSELSLDSALSTFLCFTVEEIGAMEEVDKKRKLAQTIAPLVSYEHSHEDLVEEIIKMPSDSLVKIVNEVMNNRNAETEAYRAVFDEHQLETKVNSLAFNPYLKSDLEDQERNGRDLSFFSFHSWIFGEGLEGSPNTAKPQILTSSQTFRVSIGDSVILPCDVHDLGTLVPLWKYKEHVLTAGRQVVNPDLNKYQLVNNYNLQIRNIRAIDAGDYTCYITTFGQPVILTHTVEIIGQVNDGGWSEWSAFGPCSATCGDATKRRIRTCTQPEPTNGGKDCGELSEESMSCGLQKCTENSGSCETNKGACIFPFTYDGHTYNECTNKNHDRAWCAIKEVQTGRWWDECPSSCGCPTDETITSDCLCGGNSCAKGSICVSGSTCTPGTCDVSNWPDVDSGLSCGQCKALINHMNKKYITCDKYCNTIGRGCSGAWEEKDDNCEVKSTETCSHPFTDTTDAICACGPQMTGLRCMGINDGCCTEENPCEENDGDCDNSNQCDGALVCGSNNCAWGDGDNCCEKLWRDDGRCGDRYPLRNGQTGQCDPTANADGKGPCCDGHGWCGNSDAHCKCLQCVNYAGTCPAKADLSSVLLDNNWRTQIQLNNMSYYDKRSAVIVEAAKMTAHKDTELQGRSTYGDFGSLTAIANMAAILIKYSIRCRSDVKMKTYEPGLRNIFIIETSQRFVIEIDQLKKMNDHQLLERFCTDQATTTTTPSSINCAGCVENIEDGIDYEGLYLSHSHVKKNNQEECRDICRVTKGCQFWTFVEGRTINCHLKHSSQGKIPHSGMVSGNVCKDCPADQILEEWCMCGSSSCTKGNICDFGSTCISDCPTDENISSECVCGSDRCAVGKICVSGSLTCTQVIDPDCQITETRIFGSRNGDEFDTKSINFEDIKNIRIRESDIIEGFVIEFMDGSTTPFFGGIEFVNRSTTITRPRDPQSDNHHETIFGVGEETIYHFHEENPTKITVEWSTTDNWFGSVVTSLTFISKNETKKTKFGGRKADGQLPPHSFEIENEFRLSQTIDIFCHLGFHGYIQETGISIAIKTGCDGHWEFGVEYPGNDLLSCHESKKYSPKECQKFCQTNPECVGWEWGFDRDNCCIKKALQNKKTAIGRRVSGKRRSCVKLRDCAEGEIVSNDASADDFCLCQKRKICVATHKCSMDGTCIQGCEIQDGVVYRKDNSSGQGYALDGPFFYTPPHYACTGLKFLPEIRKLMIILETENFKLKERQDLKEVNDDITSSDEELTLEIMSTSSAYLNDCRELRSCDWKTIVDFKDRIMSNFYWINGATQVTSDFLKRFDSGKDKFKEKANNLMTMSDCPFYKVSTESHCMCEEHSICADTQGCGRGYCYQICPFDNSIVKDECFCKSNETGSLAFCMTGNRCLTDGHCHHGYKISGVSTRPVTVSNTSTLWTYKEELIHSILFVPEDFVGEATFQISSPHADATVFLLLTEVEDNILIEKLLEEGWGLKEAGGGNWVVQRDNPVQKHQQMWYKKFGHGNIRDSRKKDSGKVASTDVVPKIRFTTNAGGAKLAIFFSTDCPMDRQLKANCFCKNAGKFCQTGQVCHNEGFCNNLALLPPFF